jgi:hypothetical protein
MITGSEAHMSPSWGTPGLHCLFQTKEAAEHLLSRMQDEVVQTEFNICASTGNYVCIFDIPRFNVALWVHYPSEEKVIL